MCDAFMKLVDRGYSSHDLSSLSKHPEMLNQLMHYMVSNGQLMHHWHEMMLKNDSLMIKTLNNWTFQMKDDPKLLKNMLGPMTIDPKLRDQMIQTMKNHPIMELSLRPDSLWMESIHQPITSSSIENDQDSMNNCYTCGTTQETMPKPSCSWCPDFERQSTYRLWQDLSNSGKIMEIINNMWTNSGTSKEIHNIMIQDPSHMAQMADQMMDSMLNVIMDDEILRQQMINLMLENDDFMNSKDMKIHHRSIKNP